MRKIFISEEQEKILSDKIRDMEILNRISDKIKTDIATDNTPLSDIGIPIGINKELLNARIIDAYRKARDNFSDKIEAVPVRDITNKLDKLVAICKKKEEKIRYELEKLCVDVVTSYFNTEEFSDITIECRLVNDLTKNDFRIKPSKQTNLSLLGNTKYEKERQLVEMRKMANMLSMGGAISLYDNLQDNFIGELFKLDEDLPHLYSKILKINEYLAFVSNIKIKDGETHQTGCVSVILNKNKGNKIVATGTLFPFLLIESLRGCIEMLSDSMFDNDGFDSVMEISDILVDEPWYMLIGRGLWNGIVGEQNDIYVIKELFKKREYPDVFNTIVKKAFIGEPDGCEYIKNVLYRDAEYNKGYSDFENALNKKRNEPELIDDEGEIIDEAQYPSNFNIDEFKSIRSFAGKVTYCRERLQFLGRGSARIVFKIDDGTALKLAWNKKGVAQNQTEAQVNDDYYMGMYSMFPKVYEVGENYMWIEMELARKAKPNDFKRLTGYGWDIMQWWIIFCQSNAGSRMWQRQVPGEIKEIFNSEEFQDNYDDSIFSEIEDYCGNFGVDRTGDFVRLSSWGVIGSGNEERLAVIDNGLNGEVYEKTLINFL